MGESPSTPRTEGDSKERGEACSAFPGGGGRAPDVDGPASGPTGPSGWNGPASGVAQPAQRPASGLGLPEQKPASGVAQPADKPASGEAQPAERPAVGLAQAERPAAGRVLPAYLARRIVSRTV